MNSAAFRILRQLTATRRRQIILAVAVLLMLAVGPYLVSRLLSTGRQVRVRSAVAGQESSAPAVPADPVTTLRVLTYNIAHVRGTTQSNWAGTRDEKQQRIEEIARLIAATRADVVVLNEVDFSATWSGHQNQAEAIARAAGYPHWVEQRNLDSRFLYGCWKFGNAVLSRYPIVAAELLELPALRTSERIFAGSKQACVCTLDLSPGQQVRILAVHLEYRSEEIRVDSVAALLEAEGASEIPLIAAGDFNSTPSNFPASRQTAAGDNAMNVLFDSGRFAAHAAAPPRAEELTFTSTAPVRVIDWILIPAGWQFGDYRVIDSQLSDHRPVVADVLLPGSGD